MKSLRTEGQSDNRWSEKLTWAFGSGELKITTFQYILTDSKISSSLIVCNTRTLNKYGDFDSLKHLKPTLGTMFLLTVKTCIIPKFEKLWINQHMINVHQKMGMIRNSSTEYREKDPFLIEFKPSFEKDQLKHKEQCILRWSTGLVKDYFCFWTYIKRHINQYFTF